MWQGDIAYPISYQQNDCDSIKEIDERRAKSQLRPRLM